MTWTFIVTVFLPNRIRLTDTFNARCEQDCREQAELKYPLAERFEIDRAD